MYNTVQYMFEQTQIPNKNTFSYLLTWPNGVLPERIIVLRYNKSGNIDANKKHLQTVELNKKMPIFKRKIQFNNLHPLPHINDING